MKNSLQFPGAAYQLCLDEAFRQSPLLIRNWCSRLLVFMERRSQSAADTAEKYLFQNATAVLRKNQLAIAQGFEQELLKAVANNAPSIQGQATPNSAHAFSALNFVKNPLTGDDRILEAVEISRLLQVVSLACEASLAAFFTQLRTVQGLQGVDVHSNSLRPEIMVQALHAVLQTFSVNSLTRRCWLTHGAQVLGEELQSLYSGLDDFLTAQKTVPAADGVKVLRNGIMPGIRTEDDGIFRLESKRLSTVENLHHLLSTGQDDPDQRLSRWSGNGSKKTIDQDFSHTLPAALSVLMVPQAPPPGGQQSAAVQPSSPQPVALLREHLKTAAQSPGQALAIDVVKMMVEQITQDDRLLPPVRQIIANAEPAFLRVAATDPRFFSDKGHPARCLLDLITHSSLRYARDDAPGFSSFLISLKETALHLTEEDASDAQHFVNLLKEFEGKLARHSPENRQLQQRAEQAQLQAELRNLVAGKIAAEIRLRPDFIDSNRVIATFVMGPWAQVLAHERMAGAPVSPVNMGNIVKPASPEKSVFSLTLANLLWSANPAQASMDRKRLQKIIPGMLRSLREGLLLIDYPLEESRTFFVELMGCHQAALKTPGKSFNALASASPVAAFQAGHSPGDAVAIDEDDFGDTQLWLAPTEVQHSGFMLESVFVSPEPKPALPHPPMAETPGKAEIADTAETVVQAAKPQSLVKSTDLQLGAWVEMLVNMYWLRAQLTWVSPHNTLFMFTSEKGRKHSMTARVLQNLMQQELVKVISQDGVIDSALDHALESVAQAALGRGIRQY